MRKQLFLLLLCFISSISLLIGQQDQVKALESRLASTTGSQRVNILNDLSTLLLPLDKAKAESYAKEAYKLAKRGSNYSGLMESSYFLGSLERNKQRWLKAISYYETGISAAKALKNRTAEAQGWDALIDIFRRTNKSGKLDEAQKNYQQLSRRIDLEKKESKLEKTEQALSLAELEKRRIRAEKSLVEEALNLTEEEKAIKEAELAKITQEKAELQIKTLRLENETVKNELELMENEKQLIENQASSRRQNFLYLVLSMALLAGLSISLLLLRNIRLKRDRAEEKTTMQRQILQQEKMATLGQLTAGIAHELKNPLNFVNNFSEGSTYLVEEIEETLTSGKGKLDAEQIADISEVVKELKQNAIDILHHGKRAELIVDSMMEHTRRGEGKWQETDINSLLDNNINLAVHSFQGDNPDLDIKIQRQWDESIPMFQVIPQDLSRVFVNLLNNACYAVFQKAQEQQNGFTPEIQVSSRLENQQAIVRIRDNGTGIPAEVVDKIFNPFFTTKPTGEGNTGLGLSISYDIVVKGHEGNMEVQSEPGSFTEFTIQLPIKNIAVVPQ